MEAMTQVNDLYRLNNLQFGDITIIFIDEDIIKFTWRNHGGYELTTIAPLGWWAEQQKTKLP